MRIALLLALVACTSKPLPATDAGDDDDTVGDDDDDTVGDDDDTVGDDDDTVGDDDDTVGDDDDDTSLSATGHTGATGDDDDDTVTPGDADSDGFAVPDDCDDADPLAYPGAPERCNGNDDDCDGSPHPDEADVAACAQCEAAGWFDDTRGLSGAALSTVVAALVQAQTCADYSVAREFLFAELDNDAGTIQCRYTGKTRTGVGAGFNDWDDMNTEHTWPQSQGASNPPAQCDLHHLFITDSLTNSQRGNYPFGEVVNDTLSILRVSGGQSRLGTNASGVTVFEPRDEHKGNVARAMTYFAHRYGYTLSASELSIYQAWHSSDPVDAEELDRTWAIADEQVLPNPFVVCTDLLPAL